MRTLLFHSLYYIIQFLFPAFFFLWLWLTLLAVAATSPSPSLPISMDGLPSYSSSHAIHLPISLTSTGFRNSGLNFGIIRKMQNSVPNAMAGLGPASGNGEEGSVEVVVLAEIKRPNQGTSSTRKFEETTPPISRKCTDENNRLTPPNLVPPKTVFGHPERWYVSPTDSIVSPVSRRLHSRNRCIRPLPPAIVPPKAD